MEGLYLNADGRLVPWHDLDEAEWDFYSGRASTYIAAMGVTVAEYAADFWESGRAPWWPDDEAGEWPPDPGWG